jgi:hypothetical protein
MPILRSNPASWVLLAAATMLSICAGRATAASAPTGPTVDWTTATPSASPPPLANAAAAYDDDTSTLVLFGGMNSLTHSLSDQTWIWNGSTWTEAKMSAGQPPARQWASMAFNPTLHELILFGGQSASGGLLDDTWAWNGVSWVQPTTGSSPPPRAGAALAFDRAGNLVLFGGTGYGPGGGTTSTTTLPPIGSPPATLSDTWEWTSGGWKPAPPQATPPPARAGAALSYDAANRTTVLFGGSSTASGARPAKLLGDTWIWNGAAWAGAAPAHAPSARTGAVSDYFPALHGPLVLGGQGATADLADAWAWSGSDWLQAQVVGADPARAGGAGGFDVRTASLTVFGGTGSNGSTLGDTGLATIGASGPASTTSTTKPATTTTTSRSTTPGKGVTTTSITPPSQHPRHTPTVTHTHPPPTNPTAVTSITTVDRTAGGPSGPVDVPPTHRKGLSSAAKLSLVGLAVLIPVAAYGGMEGLAFWRRRRATTRASGPRSPS